MSIDNQLTNLKRFKTIEEAGISTILQLHFTLEGALKIITRLHKRSFSSKYLHFHLPNLYFIYDSRAASAIRYLKIKSPVVFTDSNSADSIYADYFYKCIDLQKKIKDAFHVELNPRCLDNLLMSIANENLSKKHKLSKA